MNGRWEQVDPSSDSHHSMWITQFLSGEMAAIIEADDNVDNVVERMCSNEEERNAVNRTVVQFIAAR